MKKILAACAVLFALTGSANAQGVNWNNDVYPYTEYDNHGNAFAIAGGGIITIPDGWSYDHGYMEWVDANTTAAYGACTLEAVTHNGGVYWAWFAESDIGFLPDWSVTEPVIEHNYNMYVYVYLKDAGGTLHTYSAQGIQIYYHNR